MKSIFIVAVLGAAASTASAYVCPDPQRVSWQCKQLNVFPLVCYNPKLNVKECNEKQCNQPYIDNYAACQCRRSVFEFYEHAVNVQGLITRCGGNLTNPYGNPGQYRPGQGTATFSGTATPVGPGVPATRYYGGTTYYGGKPTVIDGTTRIVSATAIVRGTTILPGTTTWVSGTPGIIRGTSTPSGPRATGKPATRYYNGTTYYGGQTGVVSGTTRIVSATAIVNGTHILPGTTTWVSGTPGIIRGTSSVRTRTRTRTRSRSVTIVPTGTGIVGTPSSVPGGGTVTLTSTRVGGTTTRVRTSKTRVGTTNVGGTTTAAPLVGPTEVPITTQSRRISPGAIAGIVLGLLGAALLAGLLGLCWRKKRAAHVATVASTHVAHGPTRTIVTEKIEPVVVKAVPATETYHASSVPTADVGGSSYTTYSTNTTTNGYNTQPRH